MKIYTQQEVITLLKKATEDIDKAVALGLYKSHTESIDDWIKCNVTNPPDFMKIGREVNTPGLLLSDIG